MESLKASFYKTFIAEDRYLLFLGGLEKTLIITLFATIMGVLIGAVVAVIKTIHKQSGSLKVANAICEFYTTVIRGTPVVVQLLITYNIIFASSTQPVLVGIAAFGINSGAYVSEIIRAGINAVDIGQTEAGRSLGLSQGITMLKIVMPQAVKNILPGSRKRIHFTAQGDIGHRLYRHDRPYKSGRTRHDKDNGRIFPLHFDRTGVPHPRLRSEFPVQKVREEACKK